MTDERRAVDLLLARFNARTLYVERDGRVTYQADDLDETDRRALQPWDRA